MHSGRTENLYLNSSSLGTQRTEDRTKTKEPPASKNPHGWVIITLVVLIILVFFILVVFTSLLFIFYNTITGQQSHLENNVNELYSKLKINKQDAVKELTSQLKSNKPDTNKNLSQEISHLRMSVTRLTSELEDHKEETNLKLKDEMSDLLETVVRIQDDLTRIKKKENIKEVSCTKCLTGWQLIQSKCYFFRENGDTWERSRQDCVKRDGDLLTLRDQAEMNALLPVIGTNRYWIGLRRRDTDTDGWMWADGSPLTFSAWNKREPNNEDGREHCAEILGGYKSLNDRNCENNIGYICKKIWSC